MSSWDIGIKRSGPLCWSELGRGWINKICGEVCIELSDNLRMADLPFEDHQGESQW
jgi:hypothetical protein